jgi:hypothetical protein
VHSARSVPRRQGRTAAIRRAIAITTCCMWWIESRRSRSRAAHAAIRGHSEARWQVMAKRPDIARVAAISPTRWPTALFGPDVGPFQELLDGAFDHTDRAGDLQHRWAADGTSS